MFNPFSYVKVPTAMQVVGVAVFGITVWKGVHGFFPSFGLISGAALTYFGKHFADLYR
jgi:hypothetical protein